MKLPNRNRDVRIEVTHRVFGEWASRFWINKGTILDGSLDEGGNFVTTVSRDFSEKAITIFPTHFKILGKFYFRKAR